MCVAAGISVSGRLKAEGGSVSGAECTGRKQQSDPSGHQREQHGRLWGEDAGQSPADQHQTQVPHTPTTGSFGTHSCTEMYSVHCVCISGL